MKKILSILVTCVLMFTLIPHQAMMASRALDSELIVYPQYDERIPRCYEYGVTVHQGGQSEKLTVYNRNTSGEQMTLRCWKPDFNRRFCEFAFTGEVRVDIEVYHDFSSYSILSVFADAPENYEINKNDDSVLYVDEKWYDPDESSAVYIVPENIKTVYIAPGSVLCSRLFVKTKDVTVCGHGILLDPYSNVYDTSITSERTARWFCVCRQIIPP